MVKTYFNTNDHRFAVVRWANTESYNVVSLNEVEVLPENQSEYSLSDFEYRVKFGQLKCKASIIFIGSKDECDTRENEILQYNQVQDTSLKKAIKPSLTAKKANQLSTENNEACRIESLNGVISALKTQLEQSEKREFDLKEQLTTAISENSQLKEQLNKLNPDNSAIEKLISFSVSILSSFGSKEIINSIDIKDKDNGPKQFLLSPDYDYRMQYPPMQYPYSTNFNQQPIYQHQQQFSQQLFTQMQQHYFHPQTHQVPTQQQIQQHHLNQQPVPTQHNTTPTTANPTVRSTTSNTTCYSWT